MGTVKRFHPFFLSLCNCHSTTCMTPISLECVDFMYSLVSSNLNTVMCATTGGSNLLMGLKQRQFKVWDSWKYDYDTYPQKETTNLHICCYLDRNLDGIKIKIILTCLTFIKLKNEKSNFLKKLTIMH